MLRGNAFRQQLPQAEVPSIFALQILPEAFFHGGIVPDCPVAIVPGIFIASADAQVGFKSGKFLCRNPGE